MNTETQTQQENAPFAPTLAQWKDLASHIGAIDEILESI